MFAIKRYVRARRPSRFLAAEVILDAGTPTRLFRSHDFGVVTFDGLPCRLPSTAVMFRRVSGLQV